MLVETKCYRNAFKDQNFLQNQSLRPRESYRISGYVTCLVQCELSSSLLMSLDKPATFQRHSQLFIFVKRKNSDPIFVYLPLWGQSMYALTSAQVEDIFQVVLVS